MHESERVRTLLAFDINVVSQGDNTSWATFSQCSRYRYALGRFWEGLSQPTFGFIPKPKTPRILIVCAMNPSTADHRPPPEGDDNTVRKLTMWAKRDGFGGLIVINAFAFRSAYPRVVRDNLTEAIGPYNDLVISRVLSLPLDMTAVAAWGAPKWKCFENRYRIVRELPEHSVLNRIVEWNVFGMTEDGLWPRHPLYLKNTTKMTRWPLAQG